TKYEASTWTKVAGTDLEGCLCGIRFKSKEFASYPDDSTRDHFGFIESSPLIEVSGGYITEYREGLTGVILDEPFNVRYLSRWNPRTHLGGNLWQKEDESRFYFNGRQRHEMYPHRLYLGEESNIESNMQ